MLWMFRLSRWFMLCGKKIVWVFCLIRFLGLLISMFLLIRLWVRVM